MAKNTRFLAKSWQFPRFFGQKSSSFKGFYPPQPEIAQLQGFYCIFKWQYFQFWSKISNFFFFKQKSKQFKRFLPPKPEIAQLQGFYFVFKWRNFWCQEHSSKSKIVKASNFPPVLTGFLLSFFLSLYSNDMTPNSRNLKKHLFSCLCLLKFPKLSWSFF